MVCVHGYAHILLRIIKEVCDTMKRILSILAALTLTASLLAACSTDTSDTGPAAAPTQSAEDSASESTDEISETVPDGAAEAQEETPEETTGETAESTQG